MNYQCARAIKVEKINKDTIKKTFSNVDRKGLTPEQWKAEMIHEIKMTDLSSKYIRCPRIKAIRDFEFDMSYCGEAIKNITLNDFFKIKDIERDLIHQGEIYHNDIKIGNILSYEGEFYIIDFGHSTLNKADFPYFTHLNLIDIGQPMLLGYIDKEIDKILSETNAHGGRISYYGMPNQSGVRDWFPRWKILKDAADWNDKRILDLGCNQGYFISSIAKEFNPRFVMGVDASEDIIQAANLHALKAQVNAYFMHLNICNGDKRNKHFDPTQNWQDKLGTNWDIVTALSLYHWVQDKEALIDYLIQFPCVIMECHGLEELKQVIDCFLIKGYEKEMVLNGSNGKYDRPIVKFYRGS